MHPFCTFLRLIVTTLVLLSAGAANAALTFQLRTGNSTTNSQSLVIDSNQCPTQGPTAMYVGGVITNTGPTTVTGISATYAGLNSNTRLAGGQVATQNVGALAAGESVGVYWFTGYSCVDNATATPSITINSSLGIQSTTINLTIKKSLSANAGGNVNSATLGPGAVVGQIVYFDAEYGFGGASTGDEHFLQPSGSEGFDARCFRLVGSQITSSNLNAATVGTLNRFYFVQGAAQSGTGKFIGIRYSFQYLCAGTSTVARPYADQTSGTQLKYTGNYDGSGSVSVSYPGATNPFTITKTVSPLSGISGSSGNLTYTVTISNPSPHATTLDRITDILPAGISFVSISSGSNVTMANSSATPVTGATGTLSFQGKLGSSYALAAGGSVSLVYTATRPASTGSYVNSATGTFGLASTPTATATFQLFTVSSMQVTKTSSVFQDWISASNPKALPNSIIQYTISVTNPNPVAMDANSVIVADATPSFSKMCVADINGGGSGPVLYTNGTPVSAMTYSFIALGNGSDAIDFSNNNGSTWGYTPVADADGCDDAITNFRVRPSGSFAANGVFRLNVRYKID